MELINVADLLPLMSLTSPPGSEEHPYIVDPIIEPIVTNHSFNVLFQNSSSPLPLPFCTHFTCYLLAFQFLVFCCGNSTGWNLLTQPTCFLSEHWPALYFYSV